MARSGPSSTADWSDAALRYPLHRAVQYYSPEGSNHPTDPSLLLLHQPTSVSIRSPNRNVLGSWTWHDRTAVLLRRMARPANAAADDGSSDDGISPRPVLLLYPPNSAETRPCYPTGAARLLFNEDDADRRRGGPGGIGGLWTLLRSRSSLERIRITAGIAFPDHPRHVELLADLSDTCKGWGRRAIVDDVFVGSDLPRRKRKRRDRDEAHAWRLRFSDEATANAWRDVLTDALSSSSAAEAAVEERWQQQQLQQLQHRIMAASATNISTTSGNNQSSRTYELRSGRSRTTSPQQQPRRHHHHQQQHRIVSASATTRSTANGDNQSSRTSERRGGGNDAASTSVDDLALCLHFALSCCKCCAVPIACMVWIGILLLALAGSLRSSNDPEYDYYYRVKEVDDAATTVGSLDSDCHDDGDGDGDDGVDKNTTDWWIASDELEDMTTTPKPWGVYFYEAVGDFFNTTRGGDLCDQDSICEEAFMPPPPPQQTLYRNGVEFLSINADLFTSFDIWLAALSCMVLLVATSSLFHQASPTVSKVLWKCRHWVSFAFYLAFAAVLAHDSYVNQWTMPLRYGLYWNGWIQSVSGAAFLLLGKAPLKKALGLPRTPISPARAASAGVSGCIVTMAVPLCFCSRYKSTQGQGEVAMLLGVGAILSFFVGLYFLGRALRHVTAFGGIPVGMYLHRASLLPARFCYSVLSLVGDATHAACSFLLRSISFVRMHIVVPILQTLSPCRDCFLDFICSVGNLAETILTHFIAIGCRIGQDTAKIIMQCITFTCLNVIEPLLQTLSAYGDCLFDFVCAAGSLAWTILADLVTVGLRIGQETERIIVQCINFVGLNVIEPALRALSAYGDCFSDFLGAVGNLAGTICTHFVTVGRRVALIIAKPLLDAMIGLLGHIVDGVIFFCRQMQTLLSSILYFAVERIFVPTFRRLCTAAGFLFSRCLVPTLSFVRRAIAETAKFANKAVATIAGPFVKKYWQLIPAGLVLNGSFIFAKASLESLSKGLLVPAIEHALGSWALLLIGLTILDVVLTAADGNLLRQHVVISDSVLRHVDLYLGYAVKKMVLSGWHALSTFLKLFLHSIDIIIRGGFRSLWAILRCVYDKVLMPLSRSAREAFSIVWNSPYLCILCSMGTLYAVYLHRNSKIHFHAVALATGTTSLLVALFHTVATLPASSLSSPPVSLTTTFLRETYEPLFAMESTAARALACWCFCCLIKLTRRQVRLKVFALPALYFYLSGLASIDLMRVFAISYMIWFALSMIVDRYEEEQRRLVAEAFPSFQAVYGRNNGRPSAGNASQTQGLTRYEQSECCICLENLNECRSNNAVLPCGHEFHDACIRNWLSNKSRCPICRRAAFGVDRVLEIAF
mmetsp:Transcript_4267/g.9220  ORF Transcript_4267/g.9220 Transcript_4267/m.9220 type:complete len:1367 (+) Transcript_4267:113-4213(+)